MDFLKKQRPKESISVDVDSFSHGQIQSKIWLCQTLEDLVSRNPDMFPNQKIRTAVLAGWNGVLPFLMFSRGRLPLQRVDLFDLNQESAAASEILNDTWRHEGLFSAHTIDINHQDFLFTESNLWINTSCEHFDDMTWWQVIPSGSLVILQGNNMPHEEHVQNFESTEDFKRFFGPWEKIYYSGGLDFKYEPFSFTRYMVIGKKD